MAMGLFNATVSDARSLRNLMAAISALVEEADFQADPNGIRLRSMDPSHVAMVDFELPSSAFESYSCPQPERIRIGLSDLLKLLRRAKSDEKLELSYDGGSRKLHLSFKGKALKRFTLPTLEHVEEEVPTPNISFNARAKLPSQLLSEAIEDARLISESVRFEVEPGRFVVRSSSELSSASIELSKEGGLIELEVKEPSKAAFGLSYLSEMVKAGASTSESVTVELSTDMPLRLNFEPSGGGKLLYYLAPRIESE
jgi:proliferating cell nuclear antigen